MIRCQKSSPPTISSSSSTQGAATPSSGASRDMSVSDCNTPISAMPSFGLRKRPDAKALAKLAEAWRPWRGVAAHLLWAYYHAVKKRDVVPVQPEAKAKKKPAKRKSKNG